MLTIVNLDIMLAKRKMSVTDCQPADISGYRSNEDTDKYEESGLSIITTCGMLFEY